MSSYQKLPGSGRVQMMMGTQKLYLGPDHLLALTTTNAAEEYRRFDYKDIKAVILRKTAAFTVVMALCLTMAVFFGAVAFFSGEFGAAFFAVLAGVFLLIAIVHGFLGPSCHARIITRLGHERLWGFSRLRQANKGMVLLRQRIEAAQAAP